MRSGVRSWAAAAVAIIGGGAGNSANLDPTVKLPSPLWSWWAKFLFQFYRVALDLIGLLPHAAEFTVPAKMREAVPLLRDC